MIRIRPYKEGYEHGFQSLDKLVEIHPWNQRNLANWQWKYMGGNPAGDSLMFFADNDGDIIGHFAAIPMNYWIHGEKVIGSHSIAMMTKPEWQNRGLGKFISDELFKELEKKQIPFTYGYPNDNAYELHLQQLGYEDIAMQPLFKRQMYDGPDVNFFSFPSSLRFQKIEKFGKEVNKLWEEAKKTFRVAVIRSDGFLNWRYIARPDVPYFAFGAYDSENLIGYCVLKVYRENGILRGHFIDLLTVPHNKEYGQFLIQNGLKFFRNKKVNEVTLWMQGSPFFQEILKEYGFEKGMTKPLICRFNLDANKYRPLLKEKDWYFTMGDTLEIF